MQTHKLSNRPHNYGETLNVIWGITQEALGIEAKSSVGALRLWGLRALGFRALGLLGV